MPLYGAPVEYALHTLVALAMAPPDVRPSARELAEFQKLPLAFMRKVLGRLERAGIVAAGEGSSGGWTLARMAESVSVLDVVDALHDREPLFECREIRARCALWPDDAVPAAARAGVCSVHAVMLAGEAAMRRELAGHSIAELAGRVRAKSRASWGEDVAAWFAGRYEGRTARR